MIPKRIPGANIILRPPKAHGPSGDHVAELAARVDGEVIMSAWEPTPDELAALNAGGLVILQVLGPQPPVMLTVHPAGGHE